MYSNALKKRVDEIKSGYPRRVPKRDLTGERFGRLEVIAQTQNSLRGQIVWECICECGEKRLLPTTALTGDQTKSCGCLQREMARKTTLLPEGEACFNRVFYMYRKRAEDKNIAFKLSREDFRRLTQENCRYCGAEPCNNYSAPRSNGTYTYNGIDRVDNAKGYTTDNVVACCKFCNQAKNSLTEQEFLSAIKRIYGHSVIGEDLVT